MSNLVDLKKAPARPEAPPPKSLADAESSKTRANLRELAHRLGTDAVARALDQAA